MGFEVFVRCLDDGHSLALSRAAVRALFPVVEEESERGRWSVRYDSNNTCDIYISAHPSNDDRLTFLTVDRPCGDLRLWESLFAILKMGKVAIYFPGGPPLVASEAVGASLPSDEVKSMGQPRCVQSARDILRIIRSS